MPASQCTACIRSGKPCSNPAWEKWEYFPHRIRTRLESVVHANGNMHGTCKKRNRTCCHLCYVHTKMALLRIARDNNVAYKVTDAAIKALVRASMHDATNEEKVAIFNMFKF